MISYRDGLIFIALKSNPVQTQLWSLSMCTAFQSILTIIISTTHTCSELKLNQWTYWDNYLWIFHPPGHCIHHDDMCVIFFLCPRAIRVKSKQAWRQAKPTEIDVIMKRNWSIRYWCLIRTLKSSNLWNQRRIREDRNSLLNCPVESPSVNLQIWWWSELNEFPLHGGQLQRQTNQARIEIRLPSRYWGFNVTDMQSVNSPKYNLTSEPDQCMRSLQHDLNVSVVKFC